MGLFKRGQVYWMRFVYRGRKIRRSTETNDRVLAKRVYDKVRGEIAEGKWFERSIGEDKTIGELLDRYIELHSIPNKSPNIVRKDRGMVREMKVYFGDRILKDMMPNVISGYLKVYCRQKRTREGKSDKELSPASINHRRTLLKHAFNLAIREWEWLRENPVDRVAPEKVRNARDRWLTIEDEVRLLDNCVIYVTCKDNVKEPRYWLKEIVLFALNTGMRQDEILSLEWPHVDLFRKTATVMRSKNGEKRTIPLNQRAFELLKVKAKVRDIRSKYIFVSEAGTKIDSGNLRRGFYNALERAEITDFRFHDLRHTFATRLAQNGTDLYSIGKLLGHKTVSMTQRYSHHCSESLRRAIEVLDSIGVGTKRDTVKEEGITQNRVIP